MTFGFVARLSGSGVVALMLLVTSAGLGSSAEPTAQGGVGGSHTVSRSATASSVAFSWGDNDSGQLGIGTVADVSDPTGMLYGANMSGRWSSLSGGGDFSCGIDTAGSAFCWGGNSSGELGNGTEDYTVDDSVPGILLAGDNSAGTWTFIDGGWNFNCGLGVNGAAYCWGKGSDGQLGTGSTADDSLPAAVGPGAKPVGDLWTHLSVGYGTACGIAAGAAYCWGYNQNGGIGNGTTTNASSPSAVEGGLSWRQISVGSLHTCGIDTSGRAYCWGWNSKGQLGVGTTDDTSVPVPVNFNGTWKTLEANEYNTCGISSDDEVYCWGANAEGQLGQGFSGGADQLTPLRVPGLSGVRLLAMGEFTTCVATAFDVYCWGRNSNGQVGDGTRVGPVAAPHLVTSGLFNGLVPTGLALGAYHSMVLMAPPTPDPPAPVPVVMSSPPVEVAAGAGDALAAVSWAAPLSPGSFTVSHYLAISTPGAHTCLVAAPALTCDVTSLSNGTAYTFTVQALTGAGWSVPSDPSEAVVPRRDAGSSVVITGAREGKRIVIAGKTAGFGMGGVLDPWLRLPGQSTFSKGATTILVSRDGTFEWSRRTGKRASVYVTTPDGSTRSNTVVIPAR